MSFFDELEDLVGDFKRRLDQRDGAVAARITGHDVERRTERRENSIDASPLDQRAGAVDARITGRHGAERRETSFDAQLLEALPMEEEPPLRQAEPLIEGEFVGVQSTIDESYIDITVDSPFAFTVVWMEGSVEGTASCTVSLLWGPEGVGATPIDFSGSTVVTFVSGDILRFHCNQPVPVLGYLQLNLIDSFPTPGVTFDVNWRIHYTRP